MVHPSHCLLVDNFRYYFTPITWVLLTFPSRYQFTIGRSWCLALDGGPPRFPQGFAVPRGTQESRRGESDLVYEVFTLYDYLFQDIPLSSSHPLCGTLQPRAELGLGYSAFPRPYLLNLNLFIFLTLLRCFSSDGALPNRYPIPI